MLSLNFSSKSEHLSDGGTYANLVLNRGITVIARVMDDKNGSSE